MLHCAKLQHKMALLCISALKCRLSYHFSKKKEEKNSSGSMCFVMPSAIFGKSIQHIHNLGMFTYGNLLRIMQWNEIPEFNDVFSLHTICMALHCCTLHR